MIRQLRNKSILITGATGLIGSTLVHLLMKANKKDDLHVKIYALVRNLEMAKKKFGNDGIEYLVADIREELDFPHDVDYLVHGASVTDSRMFVEQPVETIEVGIQGTNNMLRFAKAHHVRSMVCLSSMEVYGEGIRGKKLSEENLGVIDPLVVRSSYPESKRMIENLCISYQKEYNVPVKIIRLAQTLGPGIAYHDDRVFAEFVRCVVEERNIVLHTDGKSERMYLYTEDAASAIWTVLLKGKNAQVYNAANKDTYCSIREMAEMISREVAGGRISVTYQKNSQDSKKYMREHYLYLETQKIQALGWEAKVDLQTAFCRMVEAAKNDFKKI